MASFRRPSFKALATSAPTLTKSRGILTVLVRKPPTVLSIQSHVVSGAAGNSAAIFPMRRLGVNVWPLNTVQFSNHTQYGKWTGHVFPPEHITEIVDGIENIDQLAKCDAVLSGYLGSEAQGAAVLETVRRVKEANPNAIYCCDPVMGHPDKGCIVAPGLAEFFQKEMPSKADIICPNVLELSMLTTGKQEFPDNIFAVQQAAEELLAQGPKAVFVKHLGSAGLNPDEHFEMLLATREGTWHVTAPLIPFDRPPVGTGDLTTGTFLARVLLGATYHQAFELTAGSYYVVMAATKELNEYELQLVPAQEDLARPMLASALIQTKRMVPLVRPVR